MSKAYLILQNGRVFEGERFGAEHDVTAEIVFTTAETGYLETLTDPSFHGQMVVQTFPLIGNYGVITEDFESIAPKLSAYIVRELCETPSNFRSEGPLGDFLTKSGVVGLSGVDTRALTKVIREFGAMNAAIVSALPDSLSYFTQKLSKKELSSSVTSVTCRTPAVLNEGGSPHIVLWDFGFKHEMARRLAKSGCMVTAMPAGSTAAEILERHPDGILLSNGPGDPAVNESIIREIRRILDSGIPIFGICLGHQLLALAMGAKSAKLKYGHRGGNQPVRDTRTGELFITSQNHGYTILPKTLPENAVMSYENVNDGTCEGIEYLDRPVFSVQFHPEAHCGPEDTGFLFDKFLKMTGGDKNAAE